MKIAVDKQSVTLDTLRKDRECPLSTSKVNYIERFLELIEDSRLEKLVLEGTGTKVSSIYLNKWRNLYTLKKFSLKLFTYVSQIREES